MDWVEENLGEKNYDQTMNLSYILANKFAA